MKKRKDFSGIVFSTDPDFTFNAEEISEETYITPALQKIILKKETKHRAGKVVTLIEGFSGSEKEKEELVKKLKTHCGTGGSYKDNELLLQGDHREKLLTWFQKNGFPKAMLRK